MAEKGSVYVEIMNCPDPEPCVSVVDAPGDGGCRYPGSVPRLSHLLTARESEGFPKMANLQKH